MPATINPGKYSQAINEVDLSLLKNKSVFITGGTGFFGIWLLHLVQMLNDAGYNVSVTLLSRNPETFLQNNPKYINTNWLKWMIGDVVDYAWPDVEFDFVIHGAANTKPESLDKQLSIFENIVLGTRHVMEHAAASNAKRVLIVSSGAVYGEVPLSIGGIPEDLQTGPLTNELENAYGEGKRAAEMLSYCFAADKNIEVVTARCFAFAGEGIGEHLVLNQLLKQAALDEKIVINGSGLARRSFLHGQDLAIWLMKLLTDGNAGEVYNVGSDEVYTIKELAELIRNLVAPEKTVSVLGRQKLERRINYIPSIEKAKTKRLQVWTPLIDVIKERQRLIN